MKILFIFLLNFFVFHNSFLSQTGNKITDALFDSTQRYVYSDNIKAYNFASELKQKAKEINNKTALAYANYMFGIIDEKHGDNEAALKNYKVSLKYANEANDKLTRLTILLALSNYYINLSQTDKCIEICHQGIQEALLIGEKEIVSQFYNNLSLVHSYIQEYDKALIYSDKSIEIKKELKDGQSLANSYLNKGLILTNTNNYLEGFKYYTLAEKLFLESKTWNALTQTHINFAWDYTDLKQFKKARFHLGKALHFAEKSTDKIREAGVWNVFGYFYKNVGYNDSVVYALEKGLQLSLEAENKRNTLVAYQELANHYQNIGNTKLALDYLNRAYSLKDSIFEETKIQRAQALNTRYETKEKEKQIELLNVQQEKNQLVIQKQKFMLFSILLSIVLISILIYLLFANYKKKQLKQKEQELQNQKESERIRIARDMHDEIGAGLTRIVMRSEQVKLQLKSDNKQDVGIEETLEKMSGESRELSHSIGEIIWSLNPKNDTFDNLWAYIRNYAFAYLEAVDIDCRIDFPDQIPSFAVSPELRRNVFLIVKESLNNIVKHSEAKEVIITLFLTKDHFSFILKDNGKGIKEKCLIDSGNGIGNMKKRAEEIRGKFIFKTENGVNIEILEAKW